MKCPDCGSDAVRDEGADVNPSKNRPWSRPWRCLDCGWVEEDDNPGLAEDDDDGKIL